MSVFPSSGRIPFVMLFAKYFNAPLMFPFSINFANLLETSSIFFGSLLDVNFCWMVSAFNDKDLILPYPITVVLLRGRPRGLCFLTSCLIFCNNNAGIVCFGFKLIELSGISCVHALKSLVTSLDVFLFCVTSWVTYEDSFPRKLFPHKVHWGHLEKVLYLFLPK